MSSEAYLGKDPATLMEKAETRRLLDEAEKIFKLPESLWESKIQMLPRDQRAEMRRCLGLMKAHRPLRAIE